MPYSVLYGFSGKVKIHVFMVVPVGVRSSLKCIAFSVLASVSVELLAICLSPAPICFLVSRSRRTVLISPLPVLLAVVLPVALVINMLTVSALRRNTIMASPIPSELRIVLRQLANRASTHVSNPLRYQG